LIQAEEQQVALKDPASVVAVLQTNT